MATGSAPNVVYQLSSANSPYVNQGATIYNQTTIQSYSTFTMSFTMTLQSSSGGALDVSNNGQSMFIYVGAASPQAYKFPYTSFASEIGKAMFINFEIWNDSTASDHAQTGTHFVIYNPTNGTIGYADNTGSTGTVFMSGTSVQVQLTYTKGTSNTWALSLNGTSVLTFSDPNNANWISQSGNYWGIGTSVNNIQANMYVSKLSLSYVP